MDKHSEVELKFDADKLRLSSMFLPTTFPNSWTLDQYRCVKGADAYWTSGDKAIRHRFDGARRKSTLTVKARKSDVSLADRHEVNLPLASDIPPVDVEKFLSLAGWHKAFEIDKVSHIFHLSRGHEKFGVPEYVVVALYSVQLTEAHGTTITDDSPVQFLEVEVDATSECSEQEALEILEDFRLHFTCWLGVGAALNLSLFERYGALADARAGR